MANAYKNKSTNFYINLINNFSDTKLFGNEIADKG